MRVCLPIPGSAGAGRNARTEELGTLASATQGSTRPCSCCPSSEPCWSHSSLTAMGVAYVWQNALLLCREKLEEQSQIKKKKCSLGISGLLVASKAKNILMVFQQIINTWTAVHDFKDCC